MLEQRQGLSPRELKKASHFLEYYHTLKQRFYASFHNPQYGPSITEFFLRNPEQKDKKHGLEGFTYHSVAQELLLEREDSIIDVGWIAS